MGDSWEEIERKRMKKKENERGKTRKQVCVGDQNLIPKPKPVRLLALVLILRFLYSFLSYRLSLENVRYQIYCPLNQVLAKGWMKNVRQNQNTGRL